MRSWFSMALIKHNDRKQREEERVYIYYSLYSIILEIQGRNLKPALKLAPWRSAAHWLGQPVFLYIL